ncbi:TadE/TadG family type IV pilus assembly protein [Qipengyuania sp.]|uniref:TadE/TadG family type IV pilus assembly protein n=1 Tax=Qipengyuania sp. TaxID=2004515 RepID=UPI0037356AB9
MSARTSLLRDTAGATITEFALILVPLCTMLFGGMDLAHRMWIKTQMQGALSDSARRAGVEDPIFSAAGATLQERIKNTVREQVDPLAPGATYDLKIENFFDFSGIGNPEKLVRDVDKDGTYDRSHNDCFEDLNDNGKYDLDTGRTGVGGANDVAFYEMTLTMPRLIPIHVFVPIGDKITIKAAAAMRNQPFGDQATPPVRCGV